MLTKKLSAIILSFILISLISFNSVFLPAISAEPLDDELNKVKSQRKRRVKK